MKRLNNRNGHKYLRQVRRLLPCSNTVKAEITAPLELSLANYIADNPDMDFSGIAARFGSPESVAASCLESTDLSVILRQLRVRKRVFQIVAAIALILLLSWGGFLLHAYNDLQKSTDSYIIISNIEIVEDKTIE